MATEAVRTRGLDSEPHVAGNTLAAGDDNNHVLTPDAQLCGINLPVRGLSAVSSAGSIMRKIHTAAQFGFGGLVNAFAVKKGHSP